MKKMFTIIAIVIVSIGIIISLVFYLTSGAAKSADNFFSLIKNGQIDSAYETLSIQFKDKTTLENFKIFIETYSINDFNSVFWNSRTINPGIAELEGNIKTKNNQTVPVKISLIKEDGKWKILGIDVKRGVSQTKTIPSDTDLVKLTNDSIQLFAEAVKNNDFSVFYSSISKFWQNQITPEKIQDIFKSFVDQKIDITNLKDTDLVFTEKPIINEDEILILKGYYPYQNSSTINFQLKYIYEYPNWKLMGIKIGLSQ